MRLRGSLDEFVIDGIETTLPLFRAFARDADFVDGNDHVHRLEQSLAGGVVGLKAAAAPLRCPKTWTPATISEPSPGTGMMLEGDLITSDVVDR
jgi:acetyl/propionyl-CoA carboxylase alpha subunit